MKDNKLLITIVIIIAIAIIIGYLLGYIIYGPKIKSYETQVSSLSNRISKLYSNLTYYKLQVIKLKTENSILQMQIISHNDSDTVSHNDSDTNWSALKSQLEIVKDQLNLLLEVPQDYYAMNDKFKQYNNTYAGLETFITDFQQSGYSANVFDCKESSAYFEWALKNSGFNNVEIVTGKYPWDTTIQDGFHAWIIVYTEDKKVPIEATALIGSLVGKRTPIIYENDSDWKNYYEGYYHSYKNIYYAVLAYGNIDDWSWWNSFWGFPYERDAESY